jgi:hypothetical protein
MALGMTWRWRTRRCRASAVARPHLLVALHDFAPLEPGELRLVRGEPLELLEGPQTAGEGWCVVRDLSGARGLVPLSFVSDVESEEPAPVQGRLVAPVQGMPVQPAAAAPPPPVRIAQLEARLSLPASPAGLVPRLEKLEEFLALHAAGSLFNRLAALEAVVDGWPSDV